MKFKSYQEHLSFDDVLLYPRKSLESRQSADYWQTIYGMKTHPIIPANMDTITDWRLANEALNAGGFAILHRFMDWCDRLEAWNNCNRAQGLFISIGVSDSEFETTGFLYEEGIRRFCIDIAHGHTDKVKLLIQYIRALDKKNNSNSIIIAGNVATIEGFDFLVDAGADIIKVGIGPGSTCSTRLVTGAGVPQLNALIDIARARDFRVENNKQYIPIIGDGGLKYSGDITKALVAGADLVMSGALFAGADETPGPLIKWHDGSLWKVYRGMASKDAQVGWNNTDNIVPEGESTLVPYKGKYKDILQQLLGGLSSGMSYVGCQTIEQLHKEAQFIRVSSSVPAENRPWAKNSR